jgi:class 3 adenylate cyclase
MADLPSGTVTFLFTDIEGSTALWERDREAMAAAVQQHIALLDAVITEHGCIHFKMPVMWSRPASPRLP